MRKYPSAKDLAAKTQRGAYAVGFGCYLQIAKGGSRSWLFRFQRDGAAHNLGLGSATYVTLQEAREQAFELQRRLIRGEDILAGRQSRKAALMESTADAPSVLTRKPVPDHVMTFERASVKYVEAHEATWKGSKSREQWIASLRKYAWPLIGNKPVREIDEHDVVGVLDAMASVPETQKRMRGRLESILGWAHRTTRGYHNPAGGEHLIAEGNGNGKKHHDAMPFPSLPAFVKALRADGTVPARALEFLILTAARTDEVRGARWAEIEGDTWTIPGERMKAGKEHKVPLSPRCVEILASLPRRSEFVFPGGRTGEAMGVNVMGRCLARLYQGKATVHGLRAAFKTWASEKTDFPNEVSEAALAHTIPSAVEAAYRRGSLLEKRRELMAQWAAYCQL